MIEEFTSTGTFVGSWDTYDHIPVSEWDPQWYSQMTPCSTGSGPATTCTTGTRSSTLTHRQRLFIVSYRHLDAVYDINLTTDQPSRLSDTIGWKLGSYRGHVSSEAPKKLDRHERSRLHTQRPLDVYRDA